MVATVFSPVTDSWCNAWSVVWTVKEFYCRCWQGQDMFLSVQCHSKSVVHSALYSPFARGPFAGCSSAMEWDRLLTSVQWQDRKLWSYTSTTQIDLSQIKHKENINFYIILYKKTYVKNINFINTSIFST